jgi:hypothetical protein
MKDIVTPVPQEEVRNVIKKCLENAALVNYTKVSELTKIEGDKSVLFFLSLSLDQGCMIQLLNQLPIFRLPDSNKSLHYQNM